MSSNQKNNFSPEHFTFTAKQTYDKALEYQKFLAENPHLCAPFHIRGLEDILPLQYPGQVAVHFAKSHHGKSTGLRNVTFWAQKRTEKTNSAIAVISLEDTAETMATKFVRRYGGNFSEYQDDQIIFIGNSFGMSQNQLGMLNIENIAECLHYGLKQHPGIEHYSHIILDYIQVVGTSDDALSRERREQAIHNAKTLFGLAREFTCPVDFASQALLKKSNTNYDGSKMKIPADGDLKEAAELYEIPHIAIAYWMPKKEEGTPPGTPIDEGSWSFKVESNLIFVRIQKWRDAELQNDKNGKPFDVVGRVFPCWIQPDGEVVYDADKHRHMQLKQIS